MTTNVNHINNDPYHFIVPNYGDINKKKVLSSRE